MYNHTNFKDIYQFYDTIVGTTYINIASLSKQDIILNNYNDDSYTHKIFLKASFMIASFEDKKIYLNCPRFDFLKILFHNYTIKDIITRKSRLRRIKSPAENGIDIEFIANFEVNDFNTDIGVFEEIWKEYYE